MDAQAFDAALVNFSGNASCRRLFELMTAVATGSTGRGVGTVTAEAYLHAFTHRATPNRNRRWIGLVLYQMIESSNDILEHLRTLTKDLKLLSQVVLHEPEDLKLVAGMIIRAMILGGMEYVDFWSNGAPYSVLFPIDQTQDWIRNFQDFMDELSHLKFLHDDGDAGILYARSVTANDSSGLVREFGICVLFFEEKRLTAFVLGTAGRIPQCFDVPISHITDSEVEMVTLRSSDDDASEIVTAQLVIQFKPLPWTYLFNADERDGKQMTIVMDSMSDAREAKTIIEEIQRTTAKRKMSSSQVLDISRTPTQLENPDAEESLVQETNDEEAYDEQVSVVPETYPRDFNMNGTAISQGQPSEGSLDVGSAIISQNEDLLKGQGGAVDGRDASPGNDESSYMNLPAQNLSHEDSNMDSHLAMEPANPTAMMPTEPSHSVTRTMPQEHTQAGKLKQPSLKSIEKPNSKQATSADEYEVPDSPAKFQKAGSKKLTTYGHKSLNKATAKPKPSKVPTKSVLPKKPSQSRVSQLKPALKNRNATQSKSSNVQKAATLEPFETEAVVHDEDETNGGPRTKVNSKLVQDQSEEIVASKALETVQQKGRRSRITKIVKGVTTEGPERLPVKAKTLELEESMTTQGAQKANSKQAEERIKESTTTKTSSTSVSTAHKGIVGEASDALLEKRKPSRSRREGIEKPRTSDDNGESFQNRFEGPSKSKLSTTGMKKSGTSRSTEASKHDKEDARIYEIPSDERAASNRLKRSTRRSVAKPITYDEAESSDYGEGESDYAQQEEPTQDSYQILSPNPKKRKARKTSTTGTVAGPGKKRKSNLQVPSPVPVSARKKISADRLVAKSQPAITTKSVPTFAHQESEALQRDHSHRTEECAASPSSSPLVPPTPTAQPEVINPPRVEKRSAKTTPAGTPHAKRQKPLQGIDTDDLQHNVGRRTNSSGSHHVTEAGSPVAIPAEIPSERNMMDTLLENTTLEDDHDADGVGGLTNGEEMAVKSNDQLLLGLGENDATPSHILSSNSKTIPASPHAASRAISGHADEHEITTAGEKAERAIAASNPFKQQPMHHRQSATKFIDRLLALPSSNATPIPAPRKRAEIRTLVKTKVAKALVEVLVPQFKRSDVQIVQQTVNVLQKVVPQPPATAAFVHQVEKEAASYQPFTKPQEKPTVQLALDAKVTAARKSKLAPATELLTTPTPAYAQEDESEVDPDQTLVEKEGSSSLPPIIDDFMPSSPPIVARSQSEPRAKSIHSSSSLNEKEQRTQATEEEIEEMEWDAALQPHQKAVSDMLLRLSKRFIRHLVGSEATLVDMVADYERDGREIINKFVESHKVDHANMAGKVEAEKQRQTNELSKFAKKLMRAREEFER